MFVVSMRYCSRLLVTRAAQPRMHSSICTIPSVQYVVDFRYRLLFDRPSTIAFGLNQEPYYCDYMCLQQTKKECNHSFICHRATLFENDTRKEYFPSITIALFYLHMSYTTVSWENSVTHEGSLSKPSRLSGYYYQRGM